MSAEVDEDLARAHGLTADEYHRILERLGRVPTLVELGILSVMWSEHCSYKSSRRHLSQLPSEAPWVIQGPGENAGVVDVGDGLAVAFKMESHNHPSFIEPHQGAATGVGGIMRDVFTMGARPVATLDSLRFGQPDRPRMRHLVTGVVSGIASYGNCMGVPTVGGEIAFDPAYDRNILVNVFCLGVLRADRVFRSAAAGIGSSVVYVGSRTGRDGIHGATMASEAFGADSARKRPRVQVGDPFTEKKLLEACLELMREDAIVAIQDMGAAGLTSASCEMAARGALGIELDVRLVPRREEGMTPYEVMLSESQERMLMVVKAGREDRVHEIFARWALCCAVIGRITGDRRVVVRDGDEVVASLPVPLVSDEAPSYDRPRHPPSDLEARWVQPALAEAPLLPRLLALLSRPTIASKRWVYEQYDWSVRASTVRGPGAADAAVIRLPGADLSPTASTVRGLAMTVDVNGRMVALDPYRGAVLGALEAARNLACVGAAPLGATDCLNFGDPGKPEVMWSLVESIRGLADACRALEAPIVSGNVSLYNETEGHAVLPTPTLAMIGLVEDIRHVAGIAFRQAGDLIVMIGALDEVSHAGSELAILETGELLGRPPAADLDRARAVHAACRELVRSGIARSAHDVAEGGLLVALAECCVAGAPIGAEVDIPGEGSLARRAFGEGPSVVLVSVAPEALTEALARVRAHGAPACAIGRVGGDRLVVRGEGEVAVGALAEAWERGLERALGAG